MNDSQTGRERIPGEPRRSSELSWGLCDACDDSEGSQAAGCVCIRSLKSAVSAAGGSSVETFTP